MKQKGMRILCFLFAALVLLPHLFTHADAAPEKPEISSPCAVLYNLEFDRVLYEKGVDSRIYPAAFTKLMTALLCYEYRAVNGNITVTVTEEKLSAAGGTSMKLKAGETIPFDSLLAGLVLYNANDAALVLASTVGGSVAQFVERMNARAKELEMTGTYYANPTGVDSSIMYSTVGDTLKLCRALYRVNDFITLSSLEKASIPATNLTAVREYTNKNALVPYSYVFDYCLPGVRGMIAGYTSGAGYCVAATREKGGASNIVIVSGGTDSSEKQNGTAIGSYYDVKTLLNWVESSYAVQKVIRQDEIVCEKKVALSGGLDHMILVAEAEYADYLPYDFDKTSPLFTTEIHTDSDAFIAPIVEGQRYGSMDFFYEGEKIGSVALVAQSNISRSPMLVVWDGIVRFFSRGPAKAVLILVIAVAVLYVLILIGTVFVQARRRDRERRLAMRRLEERENQRLSQVKRREREESLDRMRRAGNFFREGFMVLAGETEISPQKKRQGKQAPPRRGVAHVPEKYRKHSPTSASQAARPNRRQREQYRATRNAAPQSVPRAAQGKARQSAAPRPVQTRPPQRTNPPPRQKSK